MKTRIKIKYMENGSVRYYPQVRISFFWCNLKDMFDCPYQDTMEKAMERINAIIRYYQSSNVIMTEIVKYP